MPFIIPDNCLTKLYSIRKDYENLSKKTFSRSPQPSALTLFLGAKNIHARDKQTQFFNKWLNALADKLQPYGYCLQLMHQIKPSDNMLEPNRLYLYQINQSIECAAIKQQGKIERLNLDAQLADCHDHIIEVLTDPAKKLDNHAESLLVQIMSEKGYRIAQLQFNSSDEIVNYLDAFKILLTAYFYIRAQIDTTYTFRSGSNSNLERLYNQSFGLSNTNMIDDETRACALLTTKLFLASNDRFKEMNRTLINSVFTIVEWLDFSNFVDEQCALLHKKYVHDYPCTAVLMPLFEVPMRLAGYTMGYLGGDMLGKSELLVSTKFAVTAAFGSSLVFVMGPSMGMGVLLLAPSYAGKLLDTFCGVSMAYLLGTAMGYIGRSVGWVAGRLADESLLIGQYVILKAFQLIMNSYHDDVPSSELTGFELIEGHRFVNGAKLSVITVKEAAALIKEYQSYPVTCEVQDDGFTVQLGQEKAAIPWDLQNIPYIEELKVKFQEKKPVAEPDMDVDIFETEMASAPLF